MKTIILGGFLGAGKTTVLMQLASYLVRQNKDVETAVVILENEISSAGIDNRLIEQADFQVENIFDGCVCCSSTGLLCNNVKKIEEDYNPAWLIIEATGMAYPDNIKETLEDEAGIKSSIIALADAKRWARTLRAMGDFVRSQLKDAAVILLNKVDLIEKDNLPALQEEVSGYNKGAKVYPIVAIEPIPDDFWAEVIMQL